MKTRIACALLFAACAAAETSAVRVLILSGHNNHEWRVSTPMLRQMLERTGRFEVRVTEEPASITRATLAKYDVIVSDYCGPRWGEPAETALETALREGKGFVVVHAASYPFGVREILGERMTNTHKREAPWPAYAKMVGSSWTEEPKTGHGRRHVYEVKFTDKQHPIAQGLPDSFFISDELYHRLKLEPGVQTIATAFDRLDVDGTGKNEPVLMTNQYGKGRVFHTILGHDATALGAAGFATSFIRGVEWAATGKVTITAEQALRIHNPDAVSVLVITGGHDYDPSFDSLFEGNPAIRANVDPHPVALNKELRKRYDVVVFYDTNHSLTDKQRENLVNFAEAGKGIVVMHHAFVNFEGWDWWRRLAGAQYLLKQSKYLHDRKFIARLEGKHPVTRGVPELYLHDETYKGMWFAPDNTVLMRTDDPTADGPLVWVTSYPKSRVVGIQPGHNRESHVDAGFRRLVHNAILWSAGRME
jgi:type 1 glutamine amidotransferase